MIRHFLVSYLTLVAVCERELHLRRRKRHEKKPCLTLNEWLKVSIARASHASMRLIGERDARPLRTLSAQCQKLIVCPAKCNQLARR